MFIFYFIESYEYISVYTYTDIYIVCVCSHTLYISYIMICFIHSKVQATFKFILLRIIKILGFLWDKLANNNGKKLDIIIFYFFVFFFSLHLFLLVGGYYFTTFQWVLSYIDMNQPWNYMYSPSRSRLSPHSPPDSSGSSQCTRPEHLSHASHLGWWSGAHYTEWSKPER